MPRDADLIRRHLHGVQDDQLSQTQCNDAKSSSSPTRPLQLFLALCCIGLLAVVQQSKAFLAAEDPQFLATLESQDLTEVVGIDGLGLDSVEATDVEFCGCTWARSVDGNSDLGSRLAAQEPQELRSAVALCIAAGAQCAGVQCDTSGGRCTPREALPRGARGSQSGFHVLKKSCSSRVRKVEQVGGRCSASAGAPLLVVLAHNRQQFLKDSITALAGLAGAEKFLLRVSLDDPSCFAEMTGAVGAVAADAGREVVVWKKTSAFPAVEGKAGINDFDASAVSKIAQHYFFAFVRAFETENATYAVFMEDDLRPAPDLLSYFFDLKWLFEADSSLLCVSAWNDNGFPSLARDQRRLFRTDHFPGLGWMTERSRWQDVKSLWSRAPTTGWDHWLRRYMALLHKQCIYPEVPRTRHIGTGTNVGEAEEAAVYSRMVLADLAPGELGNGSHLLPDVYAAAMRSLVDSSQVVQLSAIGRQPSSLSTEGPFLVSIARDEYSLLAPLLGLWPREYRGAWSGLLVVRASPQNGADLIIADRYLAAAFLPRHLRVEPALSLQIVNADPGATCDEACSSLGLACDETQLQFVNSCHHMLRAFPCEGGCGHEVGDDLPAYVHDVAMATAGQCLLFDSGSPKCDRGHPSTTRLCGCVMPPG